MSQVVIHPIDSVYVGIEADKDVLRELWDRYSFRVPNYQFIPKVKAGHWDGYIHLVNLRNRRVYKGLVPHLKNYCEHNGHEFSSECDDYETPISLLEVEDLLKSFQLPDYMDIRDYQVEGIAHCIRKQRAVILQPTGSGKSLSLYTLCRFYEKKTLIIVPTKALVTQMFNDFKEYSLKNGWSVDDNVSIIMGGYEKHNLNQIVISTWQSVYDMDKEWFDDYEMVIIDEVHEAKAKSFNTLLEKCTECDLRFGFTGTLDGIEVNKLVIEGLLGPAQKFTDTKELMDKGILSTLNIRCLLLKYSEETRKSYKKDYHDEIDFIVSHERRNKFIANLALSLPGNTLILFNYIEKQGVPLFQMLKDSNDKLDKKYGLWYIDGKVEAEERETVRQIVDAHLENNIIEASFGTFQRGINIVNLHNIILASPSKSRIRLLQSIGRGLRKRGLKTHLTVFDIADDITQNQNFRNFTFLHFGERLKLYASEKFKFKINNIKIE